MKIVRIEIGPFNVNCYILLGNEEEDAIVIDPSIASLEIKRLVKDHKVKYVLNTHGHFDHIGGNNFIKHGSSAQIVVHEKDAPLFEDSKRNLSEYFMEAVFSPPPDITFGKKGFEFTLDGCLIKSIFLPGHSEGSVGYYCEEKKTIFSGDVIFPHSIGRTDIPGGNLLVLKESIDKMLSLPEDTRVCPGHEDEFTIGEFKKAYPSIKASLGI